MERTSQLPHGDVEVAFLTPLRKRTNDQLWSQTCQLLEQTIGSLLNQSDPRFVLCIAGHDRPEILDGFDDPRIVFTTVSFGDEALHYGWPIDKTWKLATAATAASDYNPRYFMSLDADDLIHRDLVGWFSTCQSPAVLCDLGWEVDLSFGRALRRKEMSKRCQSTIAFNSAIFPLPKNRSWDEWHTLPFITVDHGDTANYLQSRNLTWEVPPMNSIAYVKGHGSNISDTAYKRNALKRRIGFRLFGKKIDESFWEYYRLVCAQRQGSPVYT